MNALQDTLSLADVAALNRLLAWAARGNGQGPYGCSRQWSIEMDRGVYRVMVHDAAKHKAWTCLHKTIALGVAEVLEKAATWE